jgi:hypothetical protein
MRLVVGYLLCLSAVAVQSSVAQPRLLDEFETLNGWEAIHSHGDASKIWMKTGEGKNGKGLQFDFEFVGYMGSVSVQKKFAVPLPENYELSFDIRAEDAPVNNVVVRLKDSIDNVWWINRTNFDFPRKWTRFAIKKYQIQYGWGPSLGGDITNLDRIEIMIDVVNGGKGKVWLDNFMLTPIVEGAHVKPTVTFSSTQKNGVPKLSEDGKSLSGWVGGGKLKQDWLQMDFGKTTNIGGLIIDWDQVDFPISFDIETSNNRRTWTKAYSVANVLGKRSYVPTKGSEGRYLRLVLNQTSRGKGCGITRLEFKDPDFSFSPNEFFAAIATSSRRGFYPKYLSKKQSYWTVIGVPGDTKEALINEQGLIETDKLSFSLEPFLYVDKRLITWNDVSLTQSLEKGYLPIPSVQWMYDKRLSLDITALASGSEGSSVLYTKYAVTNRDKEPVKGKLFVAEVPFQVNPPWQTFTIIGGAARVNRISCGKIMRVNAKTLIPLSTPTAMGAATFDQGHVTEFLKDGAVPPFAIAKDRFGYASAALQYDFDLKPGQTSEFVLTVPFHNIQTETRSLLGSASARRVFDEQKEQMIRFWESKLNSFDIRLPASAGPVVNTIKSNVAYVLINADGPATQPGSRSYERSWIRDGSLTSVAFLQMGIRDEVRRYLDWYAGFQFADGGIPCVVEAVRGPEPTPEHDSHGQFIHAITQYFEFTHDTTWLRAKWQNVLKAVRHIQYLRSLRKTDVYKNGTPEQRACFGLVPESISHEGYSWKPQHSYWDDFFIILGLKDAVRVARVLGEKNIAIEFAAERDDFRKDFYGSMRAAMKLKNIKYIPGCVELGDFSGLSTTVGITPCGELGYIPDSALAFTFDESYKQFLERKNNTVKWDAYLPYDWRFVGAYVFLGQKDKALDIFEYIMRDRRPQDWNHWAEVVMKEYDAPKSIGDMPHSWAASDFIRSVRSMLVYERERDDALVIGAGIPSPWLDDAEGVGVKNLPTYYGKLTYNIKRVGNTIMLDISGDVRMPDGKIIVSSPLSTFPKSVSGAVVQNGEIVVNAIPARIELVY